MHKEPGENKGWYWMGKHKGQGNSWLGLGIIAMVILGLFLLMYFL